MLNDLINDFNGYVFLLGRGLGDFQTFDFEWILGN